MSELSPLRSSSGPTPVSPVSRLNGSASSLDAATYGTAAVERRTDRVELSDHARFVDRLRELPDVRLERIEAARQAIAQPDYENETRLNAAIDGLLDDLQNDPDFGI